MKNSASPFIEPHIDNLRKYHVNNSQSPKVLNNWTLAVKDLFDVAGLPTAAGNPTWLATHELPTKSASAVTRLLNAGATLTGKTITDELAYSLNGQNIHYPPLVNCLSDQRFCGGSSSGSAVAVGLDLARIGLGTDTGGSIRVPASYNNLVGFRPSHGVIAMDGVVALAPSFDTVGWITKNIQDAIDVAHVLLPQHRGTLKNNKVPHCQYHVLQHLFTMSDTGKNMLDIAIELLPKAHRHMAEIPTPDLSAFSDAFRVLQGYEIWQTHGQWITQHSPQFADDIQTRFDWCKTLTRAQVEHAQQQRDTCITMLDALTGKTSAHNSEDQSLIVIPTTPGPAPRLNETPDMLAQYRNTLLTYTCLAGLTGRPQLHLPLVNKEGKAYGLSIIGPKFSDHRVLSIGQEIMERHYAKQQ